MSSEQEERLAVLAEGLRTSPVNLISSRDRSEVWGRHLYECAAVWDLVRPDEGENWIDVGTGGGLPGLVLAILSPGAHFSLIDARGKKVSAVRSFVEALELSNVRVVKGRAEQLGREEGWRAVFDGAVSRALGSLPAVVELSRGFLRDGGELWAVRGGSGPQEVEAFQSLAGRLGVGELGRFFVEGVDRETWLVRMRAEGDPPETVPRSDGVPASRPLGTEP